MLNKSERDARTCIEVWVGVSGVASDCLQKVRNRVEAIERMRQRVVGWMAGETARLRAEGVSVIVRARRVETLLEYLQSC
jgi:microcystin degradation protein MlrC